MPLRCDSRPTPLACALALTAWLLAGCTPASRESLPIPAHAVIGVEAAQLEPDFWITRAPQAKRVLLDEATIASLNARLLQHDTSVFDVESLPATLGRTQVLHWIESLSRRPTSRLYDEQGEQISAEVLDGLVDDLNLDAVPESEPTRFGLVVRRADLRTFPTSLRVFSSRGDTDIDRFQENALFPGTPVALVHRSRDGRWWFAVSALYAAWIQDEAVAHGTRREVFDYVRKSPYLVVTGSSARTVFTPELPAVSELQLDMGVRVPLLDDWPPDRPVNGQHPYTAHVIELPMRADDGSLRIAPALVPRSADVSGDYLALTRANLLRQSFKFLGERYGWGHSYNARDCSGFVSEVYRSFGIEMPRNTRDQGVSPVFDRIELGEGDSHERRLEVLRSLEIGDLIYIPRHVMMVIGHHRGMPYVIHDTVGISYPGADGAPVHVALNGVAVTPLTPLLLGERERLVDRIYSIQRIRPRTP